MPIWKPIRTLFTICTLGVALAACAVSGEERRSPVGLPAIDTDRISEITRTLASDEFEGRAPGTAGEERTIAYLVEQLEAAGLEPAGENGGWTQTVPLIRTQIGEGASFSIRSHGEAVAADFPRNLYVSTVRATEQVRIDPAPMVFVGYGVHAPERDWDDFKGVDLRGKVAVFLVNDPDFEAEAGDPVADRFGGRAMTYYGRWSYKFEEAARRGAVAALIIHEAPGAGYGWNVIESPGGENYNVVLAPDAAQPVALQGWISGDTGRELLRRAGQDWDSLKRRARTAEFQPVDLGATFSANVPVTLARLQSRNVLAKLTGRERPEESVQFAAHWDSFGMGPPDAQGRRIRPGAVDDALGVAAVIEIGRLIAAGPRPERSVSFAFWTAEERGLLGATHYASHPTLPIETMAANFTLDVLQTAGPARDFVLIGQGQSDLEDRLAQAAAAQGRTVTPDAAPERGLFYRADHFALARKGVPVLLVMALGGGVDLVDGGRAAGDRWVEEYTANCYHQPCDAWDPDWDLRGVAQDVALALRMGMDLANSRDWPQWRSGSEFQAVRQESEASRN